MYARGMGREEIAAELFISPLTVKIQFEKLRGRLDGASTLCQALAVAVAHGFIAVDGRQQELYIPAPIEEPDMVEA